MLWIICNHAFTCSKVNVVFMCVLKFTTTYVQSDSAASFQTNLPLALSRINVVCWERLFNDDWIMHQSFFSCHASGRRSPHLIITNAWCIWGLFPPPTQGYFLFRTFSYACIKRERERERRCRHVMIALCLERIEESTSRLQEVHGFSFNTKA